MSTAAATTSALDAVARLEAVVDDLQAAAWWPLADEETVEAWRRLEIVRNRLAAVEHAIIGQVEERGLAHAAGCRSTAVFAREVLRINIAEATARVKAAAALGSGRRIPSGAVTEPSYPATAAALAAGDISPRHAQLIVKTIEKLPDEISAVMDETVEGILVDTAREHDPDILAQRARDLGQVLDQDGQYHELKHRDRTRGLDLRVRVDGSSSLSGELTAEATEYLRTILDVLAAPKPETDGTKDPRSASQRRHDGLLDALKLVIRAQVLPKVAGITATILLRMDVDAYGTGTGTATTGHGITIPADVAKRWAGPETRAILILLSKTKGITAYSTSQRVFTEQQRLALMARDGGCSFPTCDAPALWTEAHHVTDWQHTHRTCVDDGAPLCKHHHDHFQQMGWTGVMINGQPHWVPPAHIDPQQRPRKNSRHDRPPP